MIINQAVIFAGGKGTRLKKISGSKPKPLVEVNSQPFLTILINKLYSNKIKKIILIVGPFKKEYEKFLTKRKYKYIKIVEDIKQLGTANALFECKKYLDENFFLLNGDSFCNENISEMYKIFSSTSNIHNLMLIKKIKNPERYGKVLIDSKGLVKNIYEKNNKSGYINLGVYLLNRELLFKHIDSSSRSFEKDCLKKLIERKLVNAYITEKEFIDIGTISSYEYSHSFFKEISQ